MKNFRNAVFIIIITSLSLSCWENPNSIAVKNWKILHKQDESVNDIIDTEGWQAAKIPSSFILPYQPNKNFQFVWLKGDFDIKNDPADYYGISTGRIKYSDSIYINGRLADSRPPAKINWFPLPRNYAIPPGTLIKGNNTIYIRLGIYDKYKGGILGDILIQPENEFERTLFIANLIYKQIPFGIVILFSSFSIMFLISFLLDRKEKIALFSIAPLVISIIYIFLPLTSYRLISFEFYCAMQFSLVPVFSILFIILFQTVYRVYLTTLNWFVIPPLVLFTLLIYFNKDAENNIIINMIIICLSLIIIIPYSIHMIYKLNSINPDKFLMYMTSLVGALILAIMIFEIYSGYAGGLYAELGEIFIPPVFLILGTVVSSREIVKRKRELELIYDKLEKLEDSRISITDTIEKKLKRLIDFLNENYKSDLSREGMAAAIGIHPNYLGRLFKIYTGKKIHEYVNYMRVNEAIKQLEKGEEKITEIAYSAGFESLATFNRVFKNVVGKRPSDYKTKKSPDID